MRSTLMTWEWRWTQAQRAGQVVIDFRDVEFMEPWAVAIFASFGLALRAKGVVVHAELDPANPANQYLAAVGLQSVLTTGPIDNPASGTPYPDSTGLRVFQSIRDAESFAARASELVSGIDEDAALRVRYCVEEIGRNAIQHASSPVGAVAIAQRFPKHGHVQIAVCDAGQGVQRSLKAYYPELVTDLESLRMAILPRTSGAAPPTVYGGSGDQNQGLGLFFTREIAWRAGGALWLASGTGLLGIQSGKESGSQRVYRTINRWEGTLAVVHLPEQSASDFGEIIGVCHQLVQDVERDAASGGLDFVDSATEFPDDAIDLKIALVQNDLEAAHALRDQKLMPAIRDGRQVVLDFAGVRFLSTSIAQALLGEAFRTPGSLTKLSLRDCTKPTEAAIRTSAALAKARYRMRPTAT